MSQSFDVRRRSSRRGRVVGSGAMTSEAEEEEGPALRQKVKQLAALVRDSKYAVAYTGAGISTAAGIPDFRGPSGVWTLQAKGKTVAEPDFAKLHPTLTHSFLRVLIETSHFRHIVTQNIDSLHRRSGVPTHNQSELHGNYSLESCPVCEARYFRSHPVWKGLTTPSSNPCTGRGRVDHRTGRLCERDECSGELESSVVLFGESLPAKEANSAWEHTDKADLALVLGSSLKVGPACDMPVQVAKNGGKLVIVNLQPTPFDGRASFVIHARCDEVMRLLAEELHLESRPEAEKSFRNSVRQPPLHEDCRQLYEDVSEYDDQKLQEFERSFMVQTSGSLPPI